MTTTIRLRGPADVLAVLPYQLGFHPTDCLVVVSLHGTRVGLIQRIDLPPTEQVPEAVAALLGPLRSDRPGSVLMVGFEPAPGRSAALLEALTSACIEAGLVVADRLVVRGDRWYSADCDDPGCCPAEGTPLPHGGQVPAVAEFVGREIAPLPDRAALESRVRAGRRLLVRAVGACAEEWFAHRRTLLDRADGELGVCRAHELAVWHELLRCDDGARDVLDLPPEELARAAVSLTDVELRDALVAWLCPGTLDLDLIAPDLLAQLQSALPVRRWYAADGEGEVLAPGPVPQPGGGGEAEGQGDADGRRGRDLHRLERRLCDLCSALPDEWAVAALTVLASFTWWRGDGALTRIALERALATDPAYRLATLLERMVDLAIRPTRARFPPASSTRTAAGHPPGRAV